MRNNTRTERMRKKALRPVKDPLRNEDVLPGWYWRTPEGQAFIKMISAQSPADVVNDPEIGWQREED